MKTNDVKRVSAQEIEINFIPLLKELFRKLWLIVLAGLILGGIVFAGAKVMIKPTYRSGFSAYVNNKQSKQNTDYLTSSDVIAAKELVLTYRSILTSNTILTAAAESIGVEKSYDYLLGEVSTEVKDETEIITVYVVDTDPQFAFNYAQAISKTAPQYMAQIVEGSSMKVIDYPKFSDKRYKPDYLRFGLFGFLIGALIVIVLVIIRFFMDDTVKSEGEVETKFSIPILGVIPDISKVSNSNSSYYYSYSYESNDHKPEGEHKNEKE